MNLNIANLDLQQKEENQENETPDVWMKMFVWSEVAINPRTKEWKFIRGWQKPINDIKSPVKTNKKVLEDFTSLDESIEEL